MDLWCGPFKAGSYPLMEANPREGELHDLPESMLGSTGGTVADPCDFVLIVSWPAFTPLTIYLGSAQ